MEQPEKKKPKSDFCSESNGGSSASRGRFFTDLWRPLTGHWGTCYLCTAASQSDLDNGRAKDRWLLPRPLHFLYPADKDLPGGIIPLSKKKGCFSQGFTLKTKTKGQVFTVHVFRMQVEATNWRRHVLMAAAALRRDVAVLSVSQSALGGQIAGDVRGQVGLIWGTMTTAHITLPLIQLTRTEIKGKCPCTNLCWWRCSPRSVCGCDRWWPPKPEKYQPRSKPPLWWRCPLWSTHRCQTQVHSPCRSLRRLQSRSWDSA